MVTDVVAAELDRLHERVAGRGHWLLARRSISSPSEIAYYICYGPRRSTPSGPGLDRGQPLARRRMLPAGQRRSRAGPLSGPHLAGLVCPHHLVHPRAGLARSQQVPGRKRGTGTSGQGMVSYTLPEIRRVLISLVQHYLPDPEHTWAWSYWRRRRQYEAQLCHYRRRGYALI